MSLRRDKGDITINSRWSKVKDSLRNDPRHKTVRHEDREVLFNECISELKAGEEESERDAKAKREEQEKLKEREREFRKRKEREEQEMERVRVKVRGKEAVASFQALLVETIKDPQASWTESKPKLEKDPQERLINPDLDPSDTEKLFQEHIKMLNEQCVHEFRALLAEVLTAEAAFRETEDGKTAINSWSTAKHLLKPDLRYSKMPRKEREVLWRQYTDEMLQRQKLALDQKEEKHVESKDLLLEPFAEEGIEKRITSDSQGMVFEVEALEMTSSSGEKIEEIGVEFEASGQDKKFEMVEIGIEPETSDTDRKTFSIIQCETHQSCLMWGGLGLTETPKEEDWKNAKKIYLMDNELFVLPKNPRCPMLSTLFLQRNYKLRTIPPSFFDYMPALQILNLSRTGIKSLPESILRLVCLNRLFLNDCHCFMILSPKVGKLKQLEVLDLEGTDIMDLPNEIKKLTNLTCLKVSLYSCMSDGRRAMQSDVVVACGIISALSHLEELMINVNPDDKLWNAYVEAIVSEVCTLQSLNTLKFYFPRVELVRQFLLNSPMWVHPSLSNFSFTIGHHVKRIMSRLPGDVEFELERWERCLKYINGVAVPREIQKVLQYSTAFFLERHATVKKLSDFGIGNMKQLKCCVVGECNEVEVIIDATDAHEEDSEENAHKEDSEADAHEEDNEANAHEEDDEIEAYREDGSSGIVSQTSGAKTIVLGSLEYLYIYYMKNLKRIWKGPVQPKCLSLLKSLTLRTCPQLTTIFTTGILDNLYNLEELTIDDCPSIKTLVSCKISVEPKTFDFLPNLKRISLHYMPGLVSISSGLHIAPRLEWLSFYNCPNLKSLSIEEVSSKRLKKIEGERSWWEALEWRSGRPSYLDDIFVPINI